MIDKRVISAAVLIPIVLILVILGGITFKIGITVLTAIALYEYISAFKNSDYKAIYYILIAGFVINLFVIYTNKMDFIMPIIHLIVLSSLVVPIFDKRYNILSSAVTIMGYTYVIEFFTMMIFIREHEFGNWLIWLVFIIAWFCDTTAYYSGRLFGKRKLCPSVSPNKTVAGFIGGIIGSTAGVILWGVLAKDITFQWYQIIMLGLIGSMVSVLGDLVASLIKRFVGIKDFGNIMPGHGGILDRFDSILFVIPVVYYYIVILLG